LEAKSTDKRFSHEEVFSDLRSRLKNRLQREYNRKRGSSTRQGYDARWRAARKHYLTEHPLCVECLKQGKLVPANIVNHIVPHKGDWQLFWDKSNWQALCKTCHDSKTAREDGRWGR
jgi:5-methylcytosine-specific restriction protein A